MKRLLLLATVAFAAGAFSQKGNTSSAGIAFKQYWTLKLSGGDPETQAKELGDAMEFIDKSYAHADTKDDAKTLMYYGKIHVEIPMCAAVSGDERLNAVDAEKSVTDGFAALKRSKEVDAKGRYEDDVDDYCNFYRGQFSQIGIKFYEEEKWSESAQALIGAGMFGEAMGASDSLYFFYGGLAAFNVDSLDMAEEAFSRTTKYGYQAGTSTYYYSQTLQKQGKTDEAETMIKAQVARYPGDKDILIEMVNLYIDSDRKPEAVVALNEAIAIDPNNGALVYTAGTIYENMEDFDNAEKQYLRAIELDAADVNSLSAMGGLYFNKGADVNNAANKLEFGDPNYDKMVADSKDFFKKAVPFLEKATEAKPDVVTYWIALRDAYGKAGDVENFKATKAKVAAMQAE
jgi:tetratricopeptide (TPR) repeat protein